MDSQNNRTMSDTLIVHLT